MPGLGVPDPRDPVGARGDGEVAVATECGAADSTKALPERTRASISGREPDACRSAGGDQPRAVGAESGAGHAGSNIQRAGRRLGVQIPQPRRAVVAGSNERLPIGTEGGGEERRAAAEDAHEASAVAVPDPRDPVVARGDDPRPVGTEGGVDHGTLLAAEAVHETTGADVTDLGGPVAARGDDQQAVPTERDSLDTAGGAS